MPSQIRDAVMLSSRTNSVFIAMHPSLPCLIGYGLAEKEQAREDLQFQWRSAVEKGEHFDRDAAGAAAASEVQINFEANGRFVMPPMLRGIADLGERALFHGSTWHFSIWNPDVLMQQGDALRIPKKIAQFYLDEAGGRAK